MIDRAYLDLHLNMSTIGVLPILPQRMPHAPFLSDTFQSRIAPALPLLMTLSWLYTISLLVKAIVWEKEEQLSAIMYCNNLRPLTHWISWLLLGLITTLPSSVIIASLLALGDMLG
jgi:hypothetical protein